MIFSIHKKLLKQYTIYENNLTKDGLTIFLLSSLGEFISQFTNNFETLFTLRPVSAEI